jgi:hypothetical protein
MQSFSMNALRALLPWLHGEERLKKLDKRAIDILTQKARISKDDSLLQRFLSEQSACCLPSKRSELRSDLQPLPRIGGPKQSSTQSPTISSLSGGSMASMALTNDVFDQSETCAMEHTKHLCTKPSLLKVPGLSFADYLWATKASRKMRLEAIYI